MDETTKTIIDRITIRHLKPVTLPRGERCTLFYDCIQLTPNDLARLAADATGDLPESTFEIAIGLAYAGIYFAAAVAGGAKVGILTADGRLAGPDVRGKKIVLVDDVVHTGGSLQRAEQIVRDAGGKVVGYACIIDRSNGKFGSTGTPLWSAYQTVME